MADTSHYILLAGALFTVGVIGVLVRRNILVVLMALGLMFNAAILVFAAFGRLYPSGEVMALMVLAVSSVGLGVGVALGVLIFRRRKTLDSGELNQLRW